MYLQEICDVDYLLPKRPFDSYKGANGHVLLCVGSNQYTGAALLAARSALRAGCGLLTVCTPDPVRSFFSSLPEVITIPTATDTWNETACKTAADAIAKKNAVGIGCGIGSADIAPLLREALNAHIPLVIDADGLNCLSRNRSLFTLLHDKVVLTPHVGEMARLLDCTVQDVLSDSLSAVRSFPCIVLLDTTCLTNIRHIKALHDAIRELEQSCRQSELDCIATDLHEAVYSLGTITGTAVDDKLLDKIFENFCVGK